MMCFGDYRERACLSYMMCSGDYRKRARYFENLPCEYITPQRDRHRLSSE